MPDTPSNRPEWTGRSRRRLAELHSLMLGVPDPERGTTKEYIDLKVQRATSSLLAAGRSRPRSPSAVDAARRMLGYEQALQGMLADASEYLGNLHQRVDALSRLRLSWRGPPPELSLEERGFRTRLLRVTGALDAFARVADNLASREAQEARRQVARTFSGLTHAPFIFVDRHQAVRDLLRDVLGPKYPREERFWHYRHPLLTQLREAHERWENAHDANLQVMLRVQQGQRLTDSEFGVKRELLKAELQFHRLKEKVLTNIDQLRLPDQAKVRLEQFTGGPHRSDFRIWDLRRALQHSLPEAGLRRVQAHGLLPRSLAERYELPPRPAESAASRTPLSQRWGKVAAFGGYGLGATAALGALFNGDYSGAVASAGFLGAAAIPDVAHYARRALPRQFAGVPGWLTAIGKRTGAAIAYTSAVADMVLCAKAIGQAEQAKARVIGIEQQRSQGKAIDPAKLADARTRLEEAEVEKAFARFNHRLGVAGGLVARCAPSWPAAVGLAAVAVNGFDTIAQFAGSKERRAMVAHWLDTLNDAAPYDTWLLQRRSPGTAEPVASLTQDTRPARTKLSPARETANDLSGWKSGSGAAEVTV